jgi:predicted RNA-binding Zn-ribbon protein involved in translation (DUF1610 family)
MRRFLRPVLIALAVVGGAAALVYGLCLLSVFQLGSAHPDPDLGRIHPYERTHRDGTPYEVYVSRTVDLTSRISGWIAGTVWGVAGAALLVLLIGDGVRLLIPGRVAVANLELAHYRAIAGPDGMTAEGLRYVDAWRDFRRRTNLGFAWMLGGLVFLVVWLPTETDRALRTGVAIAWLIGSAIAMVAKVIFRCPRCGERFSSGRRRAQTPSFCTHCGLPAHSMRPDEVSPAFADWQRANERKR